MKRLFLAVAVLAMGCGSSDDNSGGGVGASPDFAAMEARLNTPTGTFSQGSEGSIVDAYGQQQTTSSGNPFGGDSTSSTSQGLHVQTLKALSDSAACPGIQNGGSGSCACPNGGTLAYDLPPGGLSTTSKASVGSNEAVDLQLGVAAHTCGVGNGEVVDGSMFFKVKNPPPEILMSLHLTITGGDKPGRYDLDFALMNGELTFAVAVPDGNVVVSAKGSWNKGTKTGTLVVKDKNATWTCESNNGKGTCTSDKGETRNFG